MLKFGTWGELRFDKYILTNGPGCAESVANSSVAFNVLWMNYFKLDAFLAGKAWQTQWDSDKIAEDNPLNRKQIFFMHNLFSLQCNSVYCHIT